MEHSLKIINYSRRRLDVTQEQSALPSVEKRGGKHLVVAQSSCRNNSVVDESSEQMQVELFLC